MPTPLRVLLLEDREPDALLLLRELRKAGYEPECRRVDTAGDYLAGLDPGLDLILADYSLPQFNALRALQLLKERDLDIPFVVVTGTVSEEAAVECMRQGATDYLLKDRLGRLGSAVQQALHQKQLRFEKRRAENALRDSERKYRSLFESDPEAVILIDCDGNILDLNDTAARLTGKARQALIGRSFVDIGIVKNEDLPEKSNSCSLTGKSSR